MTRRLSGAAATARTKKQARVLAEEHGRLYFGLLGAVVELIAEPNPVFDQLAAEYGDPFRTVAA